MAMKYTLRKGIAMIELIFAIVILGITMMSAPMLIGQATSSSLVTFQQESIAIAAAHASALMTYAWDDANSLKRGSSTKLVTVATPNPALDLAAPPLPRFIRGPGPIMLPNSRIRVFDNPPIAAVAPINLGGGDPGDVRNDDIDDFDGLLNTFTQIQAGNTANQGEYMAQDSILNANITYMADIPPANFAANPIVFNTGLPLAGGTLASTNIKLLSVRLDSVNANTHIRLQAFVCNIGAELPQTRAGI